MSVGRGTADSRVSFSANIEDLHALVLATLRTDHGHDNDLSPAVWPGCRTCTRRAEKIVEALVPRGKSWELVAHDPQWEPAMLPVNAIGDMAPGYVCRHQLENGNGQCGGNVFSLDQAYGQHHCLVEM